MDYDVDDDAVVAISFCFLLVAKFQPCKCLADNLTISMLGHTSESLYIFYFESFRIVRKAFSLSKVKP